MSRHVNLWLIVAGILILAGGILFTFALSRCKWDFTNLNTTQLELNTYNITEPFCNISISTRTADIIFLPSDNGMCRVECYEEATAKHTVAIRENTLSIHAEETNPWGGLTFFSIPDPKITVYLPQEEYGELAIQVQTGDVELPKDLTFDAIEIYGTTGDVTVRSSSHGALKVNITTGNVRGEDLSAGSVELSVTTGSAVLTGLRCTENIFMRTTTGTVHLSNVRCNNLRSHGTNGDILLENVIASGAMDLKRTTGDIKFVTCDAAELMVKVTTGDITGTLLTNKIFTAHTTTGSVEIPETFTGGKCEISSTTGDIEISVP